MTKEEMIARRDELYNILAPKQQELDEKDHKLALMRFVWEEMSYKLFDLIDLATHFADPTAKKKIYDRPEDLDLMKKNALHSANSFQKLLDKEYDGEEWCDGSYKEWFDKYWRPALDEMHVGDCTAVASSCIRCQVEGFYKLPSTAPAGKAKGWALYSEWLNLTNELKKGE